MLANSEREAAKLAEKHIRDKQTCSQLMYLMQNTLLRKDVDEMIEIDEIQKIVVKI